MSHLPVVAIVWVFLFVGPVHSEPLHEHSLPLKGATEMIQVAGHAIDQAWDAFHKSALGGTLASPEVQTTIEQDLQRGRSLLRQARRAHHVGDIEKVENLTNQVKSIGKKIVRLSNLEKE